MTPQELGVAMEKKGGPLDGLVTSVASLKPFRAGTHKYIVLPDKWGYEWAVRIDGYSADMFQPPADLLNNQGGIIKLAALLDGDNNSYRYECNQNMDGQGFAEGVAARNALAQWNANKKGPGLWENFTPLWIGNATLQIGSFADDDALHNAADAAQWNVDDTPGFWHKSGFKVINGRLLAFEWGPIFSGIPSVNANQFAWVIGPVVQLPVRPEDKAAGFDGKVRLLCNMWTHEALIISLVTVQSLDLGQVLLGALEALAGVILTVVGAGAVGVPLIMTGAGTIAHAWDSYTGRVKATQNGLTHSLDAFLIQSKGFNQGTPKDFISENLPWIVGGIIILMLLAGSGKGN